MRRLFWVAVGAAGGIWAYRRGGEALDNARERGVIGNVALATATAGKVATKATQVMALAAEQGARTASRFSERNAVVTDRNAIDPDPKQGSAPTQGGTSR